MSIFLCMKQALELSCVSAATASRQHSLQIVETEYNVNMRSIPARCCCIGYRSFAALNWGTCFVRDSTICSSSIAHPTRSEHTETSAARVRASCLRSRCRVHRASRVTQYYKLSRPRHPHFPAAAHEAIQQHLHHNNRPLAPTAKMHPTGSELDARPAKREKKKAHFFVSSTGVSPALQPHSTVDSHGPESTLTPGTSSASASTGGSSSRRHSHGNTLAPLSHYGASGASNDGIAHSVYDEDADIAHSLSSYSTLASQSSSSLFHPLTRTTRRSRSSLAALRNALQEYQVPLDSEVDAPSSPSRSPRTPPRPAYAEEPIDTNTTAGGLPYGVEYRDAFGRVRRRDMTMSAQTSGYDLSQRRDYHRYQSVSTLDLRALGSRSALEDYGSGPERMDALVDIHRVLYRGSEGRTHASTFAAQGVEVKRVIERWFEQDCGKSFFPQVVDTTSS